jgi:type IV pilus assembly protein PilF
MPKRLKNRASILVHALVLVCGVSSLFGCASSKPNRDKENANLHLQMGTTLFTNKKYPEALRELLAAEKLDPSNATVQNNLALTYFVRDRFDIAQTHVDRAIALNPAYTEARNNRARILIERGLYSEAIDEAKRATDDLTYQTPIRSWTNISLAYFRKGDFKSARDAATAALKIERTSCFAQTILGRSLLELGLLEKRGTILLKDAAETLDRAIVACRAEGLDEAAYFAGLAHYKLGKSATAVARLQEVLHDYPEGRYAKKAESLLEIIK